MIKAIQILLFIALFTSSAFAEAGSEYVRLVKNPENKEPTSLDTSIEKLRGTDTRGNFSVDLVSAVHIGEQAYYQELNARFKNYDSVLFELIADSDHNREEIGQPSDNPLSIGQKALQDILGLSFQLEEIDYQAKNFVHADMSPEEFSSSMERRGESLSQIFLNTILYSMANQEKAVPTNLSDLLLLTMGQYRQAGFKRALARQFQNMDTMLEAINGSEGSTILSERNKVAVAVARKELAAGKRNLAIFYGGAHMPDMKAQLKKSLGVKSEGFEWLTAWNLEVQ